MFFMGARVRPSVCVAFSFDSSTAISSSSAWRDVLRDFDDADDDDDDDLDVDDGFAAAFLRGFFFFTASSSDDDDSSNYAQQH